MINDVSRIRKVGLDVINKMYKNLHIPTKSEGWDKVIFYGNEEKIDESHKGEFERLLSNVDISHDDLFLELEELIPEFFTVLNVPHDSSYHSFSISRHIYYVFKYIQNAKGSYEGSQHKELLVAALFHDIGKGVCKSFYNFKGEEKRYASFIGHENVSAQLAVTYLTKLGYTDEFIKYVVDLVQFHMIPMNMSEKSEKRLKNLITEEQYNDLMFLHTADTSAK